MSLPDSMSVYSPAAAALPADAEALAALALAAEADSLLADALAELALALAADALALPLALALAALVEPPDEQPTKAMAATITATAAKTRYLLAFIVVLPPII